MAGRLRGIIIAGIPPTFRYPGETFQLRHPGFRRDDGIYLNYFNGLD